MKSLFNLFTINIMMIMISSIVQANTLESSYSIGIFTSRSIDNTKTRLKVDTSNWDPTPEGYNAKLSKPTIFGVSFRYDCNNLLAFNWEVSTKSDQKYKKYQTSSSSLGGIGNIGNKTRYFSIYNQSFMMNVLLKGEGISESLMYNIGNSTISPYLGAGIGIMANTLKNFHSVTSDNMPASIMQDKTNYSTGYQLISGLDFRLNKNMSTGLEYRYVNSGRFKSNNYVVSNGSQVSSIVPAWSGKLKSHDIVAMLRFHL